MNPPDRQKAADMTEVLLVDDDPLMRELLAEWLGEAGYRVRQAENGASALQMLHSRPASLLITDMDMPGRDGAQTLTEARRMLPGLWAGSKALDLVDPVVSQEVGLFWAEGETVMPMASALVGIVKSLNKSGELRRRLGEPIVAPPKTPPKDTRPVLAAGSKAAGRPTRVQ